MSNANAMKQLRGPKNTKIGPCATRALPRLKNMALKVLKMGTPSTRKWGDRWTILLTNLAQCVWKAV
jgi:hypothetical protein